MGPQSTSSSAAAWRMPDGTPVLVRPIAASDVPLLRTFVHSLSAETRYKRFLSPRTPGDEELRDWVALRPMQGRSLVALGGAGLGPLLGEARYVIEADGSADLAIVVADGAQRHGLGRELITRLVVAARADGVLRLTAIALSTNRVVLAMAQELGFSLSRTTGAGWETKLRLDLESPSMWCYNAAPPARVPAAPRRRAWAEAP